MRRATASRPLDIITRLMIYRYPSEQSTLYDNLQKLMERGLVDESRRAFADEDPRRRYYELTPLGRRVLATDVERLKAVVREAALRLKAST